MPDTVQLATRVEKAQDQLFRETTRRLGTTPADALRVFVAAFNQNRGFPFDVRLGVDAGSDETEDRPETLSSVPRRLLDESA
ncbi:MAG: hypothetical protein FWD75_02355 [Propionibacteriaceae bacterium]|nr:hypothetical protein [Propionibacteriaceae bacterium]